ncbi:MAG: hypothetical protein PWP51_275 [Clostridiales bacterium]|nr:hypothetical protein [Clostridiales bacterium]MDN5297722.1 hypothetical protein [Clostridiales bacterium]
MHIAFNDGCLKDEAVNMDQKINYWFNGFEAGIAALDVVQREKLFKACAQNCIQQRSMTYYRQLYDAVDGDLNAFFESLKDVPGVNCEMIEQNKIYDLCFEKCTCPLHTEGYVKTPMLCECSKQSVLYVMSSLWCELHFDVVLCSTILRGAETCKLKITVQEHENISGKKGEPYIMAK